MTIKLKELATLLRSAASALEALDHALGTSTVLEEHEVSTSIRRALKRRKKEPKEQRKHYGSKIEQQRKRSLKYLKRFNTETPVGSGGRGKIGSLIRRGYLKRKDNGYVRTEKEYVV